MKSHQGICLLIGLGVCLSSCTLIQPGSQAPVATSPSPEPSESASASPASSPSDRPDTRIMPITIEGTVIEMELRLFDQQVLPFTTYVPVKEFQDEVSRSEHGTVAQFFFKPNGKKDQTAYVQIFLPARSTSLEEMRELLLGSRGLLATNSWQLVDRTDIVSYPWAEEKLIYQQQTSKHNFLGSIYIGSYEGQAFYALTHYPAEYTDGFEPRATVMLETLQFKDDDANSL